MYKTRLIKIIFVLLMLVFTTINISSILGEPEEKRVVQVYYEDIKPKVQTTLENKHGLMSFKSNIINKSEALITYNEKESIPEGFKGYKQLNIAYSPVVMAFPKNALEKSGKLVVEAENKSGSRTYKKDLGNILEAYAKCTKDSGIKASDLGVSGDKNYKLIIPGKEDIHRKVVIDTFILELLDGKEPTKDNIDKIKPTLDKVIKNCYETLDTVGVVKDINSSEYIMIFPEHVISEISNEKSLVYSDRVCSEQLYLYYADDLEQYIESFVSSINKDYLFNEDFDYTTGYRVEGKEFKRATVYTHSMDTVNNIKIDTGIENILGVDYWR